MERRPGVDAPRAVPALPASVPAAPALCLAAALVLGAGEARAAAVCSNTPGVGDTILCTASTSSTGNVDIDARNLAISTAASRGKGVEGRHLGRSGDVDIDLTDGSVAATGNDATGIEGFRSGGTGRISITTENLAVTAGGAAVGGDVRSILAEHNATSGDVDVDLTGGSLEATTDGSFAYGAYGLYHFGSGGISITTKNLAVTATSSQSAYGLFGRHRGSGDVGDVSITTENTVVTATVDYQYAYGLYGRQAGSGGISITTKNLAATATGGPRAYGVFGWHTGASGDLDLDLAGGSVTATATQQAYGLYGVGLPSGEISITTENLAITATGGQWALGVYGYHYGASGAVDIDLTGGSVAAAGDSTYGIRGRLAGSGGVSITARDLAVTAEGLAGQGLSGSHSGLGSVTITTDAEAKIKAPFSVGVQGASTSDANEAGRVVIDSGGATEAREVGVSGWAARSSGHTFGEGAQTADDASRTEPMIHVTSSGDVTVGPSVTDAFIRSRVAGADGTLSTAEQGVLDAIVEDGDSDALDTALDALPAAYDDDYKAQARELLRKRGFETTNPASLARLAAAEILAIPRAGVRAMALSHFAIADHVRNGDLDPAILAVPSASRTTQQRETLAEQGRLSDAERAVLEAVLTGGDVEAALDPLPVDYTDEWKDGVRQHAMSYNAGDVRVDVTGGTIVSEGHGIDARYAVRHERNGAIEVSVAEGASVTGGVAGIHVAGAGLGDLARDSEWGASLKLAEDADVTGLRRQFVTVHGTVTGGTDAAVHLAGGGALLVGETGKAHAGSSGVGVLMDGLAHVHVQGEVKGAEGEDAAAVHLTGGGSVRVGETGRVLANGAAAAIRADDPDGDTPAATVVLELGVSEGVEDNDRVAREAVLSLLERVKGPITIENDDGSPGQPVIALVGAAASGAILEGDVLNEDGALGGALDPERFSWGPCPAGQESENTGVCRVQVDVDDDRDGRPDGHGVDARYDFPRYRSGAIEVSVAEGATVTGALAGVYVEGAGLGDLARDSEWARRLNLEEDADVTGLRRQFVTVHGTVMGGTDAAVHLVGGGMLYVGPTGKVHAGSSGVGVLVNDPGVAHVHVQGEVRGAEGGAAAVHLTGGGSVRVGETGRVLANGAAAAIRADDPDGDTPAARVVLELGVSEGVAGGVAREDVQSLLERVKGPIAIEDDDGSYGRQPVIALVGGASGAILEGDVLNEDDTLGGAALDPESFPWRPCPAGQERGDGGECRDIPPPACPAGQERGDGGECRDLPPPTCPAGQERGDDGECRDLPPPTCPAGQERGDDGECRDLPPPPLPVGFNCDVAADGGDPRCRLYEALPSVLLSMNGLPTYEERTSAARDAGGAWARVEVADGKWKADESTRPNVAYDHRRHGLRVGTDFAVGGVGGVGVSLHGLRGSAEMAQGGKVELSGYGLGLHATTAFADGFHVDTQAAMTWYEADLESAHAASGALKKGVNGRGHALGVEVGRRMALRAGVSVTPRAGFTWSKVDLNDFAEDLRYGARVSVEDARSLKGRVGVGAERTWGDDMQGSRLFGSLDLERELDEETEAQVSGASPGSSVTPLKAKAERTAYRLAVGGARVWGEGRYTLRGSVGYTASGGDNRSLGGGVSFSLRF